MKRLSILAVLLIAGCKIQVDQPTVQKPTDTPAPATASKGPAPAAGTQGKSPDTATKPDAKPSATGSSATAATPSADKVLTTDDLKKMPGYNPDRIYQLGTFQTATLGINGQSLKTWIADTESKQQEGLMFVKDKDITPDESMIFVFPYAKEQGFWMKNTYIPLDIAYIGSDKTVVSTATMKPFDENNVPSHGAAQYALEMKVGTLSRLGIQKGTKIDIPDSVKSQDQAPPPQMGMGGPAG